MNNNPKQNKIDIELSLNKEQLDYLELILHNHEYEEKDRSLIDQLEYKFYEVKETYYKNQLLRLDNS
tara:strand:+ start:25 stop:225 length:201 start_codon:yes stop_codon:yes gene_type:complete